MEVTVKKLSEDLLGDFLYFFDEKAFPDNHEWESCYCVFYHYNGSDAEWLRRTREENRQEAVKLIKSGDLQGFLAYDNDVPIGWCNINEKDKFSIERMRTGGSSLKDKDTVSIVCFIVSPEYRRKGVCSKLLSNAIGYYRNKNKKFLEAYPSKNVYKDSENYHGPLSLYLKNNFKIVNEFEDYLIMRLEIDIE